MIGKEEKLIYHVNIHNLVQSDRDQQLAEYNKENDAKNYMSESQDCNQRSTDDYELLMNATTLGSSSPEAIGVYITGVVDVVNSRRAFAWKRNVPANAEELFV